MNKLVVVGAVGVPSLSDAPAGAAQSRRSAEHTVLLQAADALERAEAHHERLTDALRYFVELASGDDVSVADVKRNLANALALVHSSASISLKVQELAFKCGVLAPEDATLETSTPAPEQCPAVPIDFDLPKQEEDEKKRVNMILSEIEALLGSPAANGRPTVPLEPVPIGRTQNIENNGALAGIAGSGIDALHARPKLEDNPAISLSADPLQGKPEEARMNDPFSQEIEALLGKDAISVFSEAEAFLGNFDRVSTLNLNLSISQHRTALGWQVPPGGESWLPSRGCRRALAFTGYSFGAATILPSTAL